MCVLLNQMLINAMVKIVTILGRNGIRSNDKSIITYRLENCSIDLSRFMSMNVDDYIHVLLRIFWN